jgi:hypothetical protein
MIDLLVQAQLREMERLPDGDLAWIEDFGLTMHRQRLAHDRETRMTVEPFRHWSLIEPGWVLTSRTEGRQAKPSPLDRFVSVLGDFLVAAGTWLHRRSTPVVKLQT